MTNMTNLAMAPARQQNNLSYINFAAHAAAQKAAAQKRALCLQHRYGLCLCLLCAAVLFVGASTSFVTDMTALLLLAPLGVYLLVTKQVLLYQPHKCR